MLFSPLSGPLREWGRVRATAKEERLQRRHDNQEDDGSDEHAANNHSRERPLHLAPDTRGDGGREEPDARRALMRPKGQRHAIRPAKAT